MRNELNHRRPDPKRPAQDEVVRTYPDNIHPYMPRIFPEGVWEVGWPAKRTHPYKAPYFIPTNAYQFLPEWQLDEDGGYLRKTDHLVCDKDYGLHCSSSVTTLGCVRIHHRKDLLFIVEAINDFLSRGEQVYFDVLRVA